MASRGDGSAPQDPLRVGITSRYWWPSSLEHLWQDDASVDGTGAWSQAGKPLSLRIPLSFRHELWMRSPWRRKFPWHEVPKKPKQAFASRGRRNAARKEPGESTAVISMEYAFKGDSATGRSCLSTYRPSSFKLRPKRRRPEPEVNLPTQQNDRPYRRLRASLGQAAISFSHRPSKDLNHVDDFRRFSGSVREISGGDSHWLQD